MNHPTAAPAAVANGVTVPRLAVVIVAAYIAAQMVADISSVKIGTVLGLAVDMGTFIYPITFTLRDLVHKTLGRRNARVLIVTAAVINLLMVLYLSWSARVPGDPGSDPSGSFAAAYGAVFGPLWRITLASIVAEVASELADTEVYHWFVTRITRRRQWARVLVSNAISVPIDNALFAVLAFAPLPLLVEHPLTVPWTLVGEIFLFNLLVKFGVTLLSMPLIYLTPAVESPDV